MTGRPDRGTRPEATREDDVGAEPPADTAGARRLAADGAPVEAVHDDDPHDDDPHDDDEAGDEPDDGADGAAQEGG